MNGLRVPTKAEAKFRHEEFLRSLTERRRKPRGKRSPKRSKKNVGDSNFFDNSNEDDIEMSCDKEADVSKEDPSSSSSKVEGINLEIPTPVRHREEDIENEEHSARDHHKNVTHDTDKLYDTEKLGSELWSALQSNGINLGNLTSDELQRFVCDFCQKRELDVEKANAVLKNYIENKKRVYDSMMAQLSQIYEPVNERKSVEMRQDSEITKDTEKDENTEKDESTEHGIVVEEESDSFFEDAAIPIVRPRSPVILFEDDLSLENIMDEGTVTTKQSRSWPDLFKQDSDGDTFLHIAVVREHQSLQLLVELMEKETLDIQNRLGHTPLHLAVIVGNVEIVQSLVFHGSSVAVVDCNGNTPLHLSCQNGDYLLTSSLVHKTIAQLSCGLEAALRTRNFEGEAPLHIALSQALLSGNDDIIRLLLGVECDVNITHGRSGKTILYMALESKQYALAEFLLDYGADPNIATFSGVCPLHLAAQSGHVALVQTLIKKNAFIYAKTSDSETAKDFASNKEIIQILENAMKKERRNRQKKKSVRLRKS